MVRFSLIQPGAIGICAIVLGLFFIHGCGVIQDARTFVQASQAAGAPTEEATREARVAVRAWPETLTQRGITYPGMRHGNPAARAVALTFDDGPHPYYTEQILAILARYQVKANFFVVGKMAEQHPSFVLAEFKDGHLIGNHTYHHLDLSKLSRQEQYTEWKMCSDTVARITGEAPAFGRPPGGNYNENAMYTALENGVTPVFWSINTGDYTLPGRDLLTRRVLNNATNGSIILLHDGIQQTINVLPFVIETLQRRGYQFQRLDEMQAAMTPNA